MIVIIITTTTTIFFFFISFFFFFFIFYFIIIIIIIIIIFAANLADVAADPLGRVHAHVGDLEQRVGIEVQVATGGRGGVVRAVQPGLVVLVHGIVDVLARLVVVAVVEERAVAHGQHGVLAHNLGKVQLAAPLLRAPRTAALFGRAVLAKLAYRVAALAAGVNKEK